MPMCLRNIAYSFIVTFNQYAFNDRYLYIIVITSLRLFISCYVDIQVAKICKIHANKQMWALGSANTENCNSLRGGALEEESFNSVREGG